MNRKQRRIGWTGVLFVAALLVLGGIGAAYDSMAGSLLLWGAAIVLITVWAFVVARGSDS